MTAPGAAADPVIFGMDIRQRRWPRDDRRLNVCASGVAWYHLLAASAAAAGSLAGTFRVTLPGRDRAAVAEAIAALEGTDATPPVAPPHEPQVTIRTATGAFSYIHGASPQAVQRADTLATTICALAQESPYAVIRLEVEPRPAGSGAGLAGVFRFRAEGHAPAIFTIAPASFALRGEGWAWRPDGVVGGLMAAGGRHVDGIYAPAKLAPGELAALVVQGSPPAPPGMAHLTAVVEGTILLAGPGASEQPFVLWQRVATGL